MNGQIYTTQHTPQSGLCVFVGTGFFDFFSNKRMPRRPAEDRWTVISWYKEGLTTAELCRKTGFYKQFVTHWVSKYKDSGSVDDAPRVERAVEKKMRGKRRRSSRVIERELKRQKVSDVSYKTVQRTVHRRGLHAFIPRKPSQARSVEVRQDQHKEGLEQCGVQ